jgi:hypothetical protein
MCNAFILSIGLLADLEDGTVLGALTVQWYLTPGDQPLTALMSRHGPELTLRT